MKTAQKETEVPDKPAQKRRAKEPASIICNVSSIAAFCEDFRQPHVPVAATFGDQNLHSCRLRGTWNLERMVTDHARKLARSIRMLPGKDSKEPAAVWDDLTFRFGPRLFLYADKDRIVGFASTPEAAQKLVMRFAVKYAIPAKLDESGGVFRLIHENGHEIEAKTVSLPAATIVKQDLFELHYGKGSMQWHSDLVGKLKANKHGLSVFEGSPGTGKTHYIRHLMGVLKKTHRFYFVPTAAMSVLTRTDFVGFWAEQRWHNSEKQFVVVLEDADEVLVRRNGDNRDQVAALLNLTDGLLADFLGLHIICTINCSIAEMDPALLRPGRLLCHRVFERLDYTQAAKLAESLGHELLEERDYSLAEVYAGNEAVYLQSRKRPHIGFAV